MMWWWFRWKRGWGWWCRWRCRGWSSIITEYLVDVEELCNRSLAVNYFQLVKVLVVLVVVVVPVCQLLVRAEERRGEAI